MSRWESCCQCMGRYRWAALQGHSRHGRRDRRSRCRARWRSGHRRTRCCARRHRGCVRGRGRARSTRGSKLRFLALALGGGGGGSRRRGRLRCAKLGLVLRCGRRRGPGGRDHADFHSRLSLEERADHIDEREVGLALDAAASIQRFHQCAVGRGQLGLASQGKGYLTLDITQLEFPRNMGVQCFSEFVHRPANCTTMTDTLSLHGPLRACRMSALHAPSGSLPVRWWAISASESSRYRPSLHSR